MEYSQVLPESSAKNNEQTDLSKSWQNAMDHAGEIFEEDAKNLHWVTSTVEFSNAAATGESFQAKGNHNANAKSKA